MFGQYQRYFTVHLATSSISSSPLRHQLVHLLYTPKDGDIYVIACFLSLSLVFSSPESYKSLKLAYVACPQIEQLLFP